MSEQNTASPPATVAQTLRKRLWFIVLLVIILGIVIWRLTFAASRIPDSIVILSGRIDDIRFREGDSVKAGDTIAVLDDEQVRAREEQARAALAVSEARQSAAMSQLAALQAQLEQTQIQTDQSRTDAEGRVRQAEAELSSVEAELAQQ